MGCIHLKNSNKGQLDLKEVAHASNSAILNTTFSKENFVRKNVSLFSQYYELKQSLGKGQFGEVKLAIHKGSMQSRAMKIINKSSILKNAVLKHNVLSEFNILKKLDHPNVMKIYEAFEDENFIYISME